MLHQTFLFSGQLWQLFEVSQILEFLRYLLTASAAVTLLSMRFTWYSKASMMSQIKLTGRFK